MDFLLLKSTSLEQNYSEILLFWGILKNKGLTLIYYKSDLLLVPSQLLVRLSELSSGKSRKEVQLAGQCGGSYDLRKLP